MQALKKLVQGKAARSADTTRPLRKVYLERAIQDILDVCPVLRIPKWVRFNLCVCVCVCMCICSRACAYVCVCVLES